MAESDGKISIIVPVYNSEKFLPKCIDSILRQTYSNIELILLDDGSTDDSGEICDEYSQKNCLVHTIHKENGGSTSARKAGVEMATGRYIGFVDSDDWIEEEMYETLVRTMVNEKVDIVTTGCVEENSGSKTVYFDTIPVGTYNVEFMGDLAKSVFNAEQNRILPGMWNKLYRNDLVKRTMNCISDEIVYGEDLLFNFVYLSYCMRAAVKREAYYHYVKNSNSVCHSFHENFLRNVDVLYKCALKVAKTMGNSVEIKAALDRYVSKLLCFGINQLMGMDESAQIPIYMIPLDLFCREKTRVILYGAGRIGRLYRKQILNNKNLELVLWVDKKYQELQDENIRSVEEIKEVSFDFIVVAVRSEAMAKDIVDGLVQNLGIEKKKICWKAPIALF